MIPNHPIGKDLLSAADLSLDDIETILARATTIMEDNADSALAKPEFALRLTAREDYV